MSDGPLVLGGGLAGAAVATMLARAGVAVTLVEQHAEPRHKMCGEFLSVEACESLQAMGLDVGALGAVPVRRVRLASAGRCVTHDLPFEAQSLTRRALDEAMLEMAAASGVEVRRGVRVEALEESAGAWRVRVSGDRGDEMMCARNIFVASGKHDLRGHARPDGAHAGDGALIAFKQYFRLTEAQQAELDGAVELILFRGGYAGLQMVEGGCANLCLLVRSGRYRQIGAGGNASGGGASWGALLEAMTSESGHLRRRLEGAEAMLERPLSLSRIPYGFVRREVGARGLWYLGDQAAVIPSFSGDGMSIALHTARVAAEVYLRGLQAEECTKRLARELGGLVGRATMLSRLMVSGAGQGVVSSAVGIAPSLLQRGAAWTRIPVRVRASNG